MSKVDIQKELESEEFKMEYYRTVTMRHSMTSCLLFCFMNTNRDPDTATKNFTLRLLDDLTQSVISMEYLAKEGFMNVCKRELRYFLELSLKSCVIVNSTDGSSFEDQIKKFEKLLNSSNINPINQLPIRYLDITQVADFKDEVKRLYGLLCNYVHASSYQILERVEQAKDGRTIGYEGTLALTELNSLIERTYAAVIVFLFNSVPQYVVSDYLVESDGSINTWYFNQSKYIGIIDSQFDYKAERQHKLKELVLERTNSIRF